MNGMEAATTIARSSAYYSDSLSEGMLALVQCKRDFTDIEQARKYASASAFKRASASISKQAREREQWLLASVDACTSDIADTLVNSDTCTRVQQAVLALPTIERTLVIDKYYRDKSVSSIAREYGTTRASVRYLLAKAQARLRDSLQDLQ